MSAVTVTPSGLSLAGRHHRLLSGEIHYWRNDPAHWPAIIDAVAELGFSTVSTYVSWARHERAPGAFDTSGRFDIRGFLHAVTARGLKAVVRVGPNTAGEQEDSGWPRRVLDDPDCQARRPGGLPYLLATATGHALMPSYASRTTLGEIARWYDTVAGWLRDLQFPDGPIVAIQVDNELGYHFQSHAYALDYHPDAIAVYRRFLSERYASIASLNEAYDARWHGFEDLEPPRDGVEDPGAWHIDWVRFKEHHLRDTLATLASMLRERGLDRVPLVHNDYPRTTTPHDLGALERSGAVDIAGADIYAGKEGGTAVRDLARHLVGSSRLPYMAELGTGWLTLPWLLPLRTQPLDEEHAALRAFIHGARAANVYQLVERDRWYGSPISARGEPREPKASFYRRLHAMLDELSWEHLRRDAPVLILENRALARRIAARARYGDIVPCFSQLFPFDLRLLEPDDAEADALAAWNRDVNAACMRAGFEADRASSDAPPSLDTYRVIAVARPELLETPIPPGAVSTPEELARALASMPVPAFRCDAPEVELVRFTGGREVLAVVNGGATDVTSTVRFDGDVTLRGVWREETLAGRDAVQLQIGAWQSQVWEVSR